MCHERRRVCQNDEKKGKLHHDRVATHIDANATSMQSRVIKQQEVNGWARMGRGRERKCADKQTCVTEPRHRASRNPRMYSRSSSGSNHSTDSPYSDPAMAACLLPTDMPSTPSSSVISAWAPTHRHPRDVRPATVRGARRGRKLSK